jgi:DNA invertase Pin-like site-specific DNA recombinase
MLIGFASGVLNANEKTDAEILRQAACDRVYSAEHGVLVFEQLMDYLRPGDVAVVTSLRHVGSNLAEMISVVTRLHAAKIGLQVVGSEIVPDTPLGDAFPQICAILKRHDSESEGLNRSANSKARPRGRPPVLTAETKIRIERLLRAGRLSVSEIAQVLDVSAATIYRHFPGGGRPIQSKTNRGKRLAARSPASSRIR